MTFKQFHQEMISTIRQKVTIVSMNKQIEIICGNTENVKDAITKAKRVPEFKGYKVEEVIEEDKFPDLKVTLIFN